MDFQVPLSCTSSYQRSSSAHTHRHTSPQMLPSQGRTYKTPSEAHPTPCKWANRSYPTSPSTSSSLLLPPTSSHSQNLRRLPPHTSSRSWPRNRFLPRSIWSHSQQHHPPGLL